MGRKSILKPYSAISNGDMSASITSELTNIEQIDYPVVSIEWTGGSGATAGTFQMQHQLDTTTTWIAYDFGTTINITGASGSHDLQFTVPLAQVNVRFVYTRTGGAGTLNVKIAGKTVGA